MFANISWDFTIYDFDTEDMTVIRSRPSDYIGMEMALSKELADLPTAAQQNYNNYGVVYFALKRMGKLGDYGVDEDAPIMDALDKLTQRIAFSFQPVEVDDSPLATRPKR